jgi:hypothetical protein
MNETKHCFWAGKQSNDGCDSSDQYFLKINLPELENSALAKTERVN